LCLVAEVRGQLVLTSPADSFVRRVTWEGDTAAEWRPHDDPHSPVRMNPDVRFGRPAVAGVATEVFWEHEGAGESIEGIADEFGVAPDQVMWALAYETSARRAA
jgi:uncharacterized protein (DUF433 family)